MGAQPESQTKKFKRGGKAESFPAKPGAGSLKAGSAAAQGRRGKSRRARKRRKDFRSIGKKHTFLTDPSSLKKAGLIQSTNTLLTGPGIGKKSGAFKTLLGA